VPAEIHLVVGLVEGAKTRVDLSFVVIFEACSRGHIEHAVTAIAVSRGIPPALGLQVIDIFWIDLRADIAGDIRVRNGNAIDRPRHLVAAPNVELIVRHPSAGDEIGHHIEAI
jgi:hypothetical protein